MSVRHENTNQGDDAVTEAGNKSPNTGACMLVGDSKTSKDGQIKRST